MYQDILIKTIIVKHKLKYIVYYFNDISII